MGEDCGPVGGMVNVFPGVMSEALQLLLWQRAFALCYNEV